MSQTSTAGQLDLSVSAQLIEDHLDVSHIPSPKLGEGEIAAFKDGMASVDGDGVLLVERSAASHSGWSSATLAVPRPQMAGDGGILKLKAFTVTGSVGRRTATILNLLCLFPASPGVDGFSVSWMRRVTLDASGSEGASVGPWTQAPADARVTGLLAQVRDLDAVDCGPGVSWVVYGVTAPIFGRAEFARAFTVGLVSPSGAVDGAWAVTSSAPRSALPGSSPRMAILAAMSSGGPDARYAAALCCYDDSNLKVAILGQARDLTSVGQYQTHTFATSAHRVVQLIPAPVDKSSVVPPTDGQIWSAFRIDGANVLHRVDISPRGIISYDLLSTRAPAKAPAGAIQFCLATHGDVRSGFAVDPDGALWTARDVTSSRPGWTPLGNRVKVVRRSTPGGARVAAIAAPPATARALQLFYAVDGAANRVTLHHLTQEGPGGLWQDHVVATFRNAQAGADGAGADAYRRVSTVSMDVVVTSKGAPVPNSIVTVSSNALSVLIVRGSGKSEASYWVGDGGEASFATDGMGRATVRLWARSLGFPELELVAYGPQQGPEGRKRWLTSAPRLCRGDMVDDVPPPRSSLASRLNGKDNGSKPGSFALTPARMMQKQTFGKGQTATYALLPASAANPVKPGSKQTQGDQVVSLLNDIGQFMMRKDPNAGVQASASEAKLWKLSVAGGAFNVERDPVLAVGIWDDFKDFAGDALHYAAHAADVASDWTIHIVDDAIHVAIAGFKCAIKTAEEAGALAGTLLHSIQKGIADVEQFIRDVVAFFEMLFAWDDILKTHDALRQIMKSVMKYAQSDQLETDANAKIDDFTKKIVTALDYLGGIKRDPSKLQPASAYADTQARASGNLPSSLSMPIVKGDASRQHLKQHASRCHYVFGHARAHAAVKPTPPSGKDYDKKSIDKYWYSKGPGKTQSQRNVTSLVGQAKTTDQNNLLSDQPSSPLIDLFVTLIEDAKQGVEFVADDVLKMVGGAVKATDDALTASPHIPFISWLYKYVITDGDDLNLLDLFCLILAVPGTILFKLITEDVSPFDGGPPVTDDDLKVIARLFPETGPWNLEATIKAVFPSAPGDAAGAVDAAGPMPAINRYAMLLSILAAVVGLFGSSISTVLDYYTCDNLATGAPTTEEQTILGYVAVILAAATTALSLPLTTFADGDGEKIATSTLYWASQFLPIASDTAALLFAKQVTKMFGEGAGAIAEGLFGIVIATLGVLYAFEGGASHWDIAGMATNCFPRPWRLLMAGIDAAPEDYPILMPFVMVTDAIGIVGGTATTIGAGIVDNR